MVRSIGSLTVLSFLSLVSLTAQTPQARLRIPLAAADSGAITRSYQLYLCLHPDATLRFDAGTFSGFSLCGVADTAHVQEILSPADPVTGVFHFSPFNSAECNISFYKDDVRKYVDSTQSDTFKVLLRTEPDLIDTHAVSYTWPACIGQIADSVILQQRIGPTAPGAYRIDMSTRSSFTLRVSTGGINSSFTVNSYVIIKGPRPNQVVAVDDAASPLPAELGLLQNFPNPFNPSTRIDYTIARAGHATLAIFNLLGQPVATPLDADETPGKKSVTWDASGIPAGLYLYRLSTADGVRVRKMVLIK